MENLCNIYIYIHFQTLVALNEVTKEINRGSSDYYAINATDYTRFLVISLGTGTPKNEVKYDALRAAKWGLLGWLSSESSTPLVDVFMQSSSDMTDFHIYTVFKAFHSENGYLRIQDDTLSGNEASVDVATEKNLKSLVEIGERLLKKPVTKVNFETGLCEPCDQGTNEEALIRCVIVN